ncbi:hypothetical protein ZWY2020_020296 [Hordeum vulgare]|nr:hypothetical protein ZWY2020_020296 [Hordeum vulgare]
MDRAREILEIKSGGLVVWTKGDWKHESNAEPSTNHNDDAHGVFRGIDPSLAVHAYEEPVEGTLYEREVNRLMDSLGPRSTRKLVLQIPRSSAISLLQKIRQLGGIAIMHTLVACLHQTEPEQRVLAAKLFLQLDMLQQQIKSKIGPRAAVVVSARQERNDAIVELREKQGKKLSSKIEVPIGPLPWAPLSLCSFDPSVDKMELAKAHFMVEEDHPRR